VINLYLTSPISPCFNVQSRRERDTLASFYTILLTLRLFCAFRENLRVLLAKIEFWKDWGEEQRFEKARGIKNKAKRANGRRYRRASRHTTVRQNTTHDPPASNLARSGRARWAPPRVNMFTIFFLWGILHSVFFLSFPLALELERETWESPQNLRFSLNLCFWIEDCEDWSIILHSQSI